MYQIFNSKRFQCVVEDDKLVAIVDGEGVKYTAVNWSEIQAKGVNK